MDGGPSFILQKSGVMVYPDLSLQIAVDARTEKSSGLHKYTRCSFAALTRISLV